MSFKKIKWMKYMSTLDVKLVTTKTCGGTEVYFHEFLTSALGGGAFLGLIAAALNTAEQSPLDWK
jgi:hypothetical protein